MESVKEKRRRLNAQAQTSKSGGEDTEEDEITPVTPTAHRNARRKPGSGRSGGRSGDGSGCGPHVASNAVTKGTVDNCTGDKCDSDFPMPQRHSVIRFKRKDGNVCKCALRKLWGCRSCKFYCHQADDMKAHLRSASHFSLFGKNARM